MATNYGVFIRSSQNYDEIISACKNLINDTKSGGRILRAKKDPIYGGLQVYLSEESLIQKFLQKQNLGFLSTIHPLITHLTVCDARLLSTLEEKFIENLRNHIQEDLGKVLEVSKIPFSKLHPDIGNCNWEVTLDIPEIEDLDAFKKVGLPNNYFIDLPGSIEKLFVTFHCIRCEKDGNCQWRCNAKKEDIQRDVDRSIFQSIKREDSPESSPSLVQRFFIRDPEEERQEQDSSSKSKPLLPRENMREFESIIGNEEANQDCLPLPLAEKIAQKEIENPFQKTFSDEVHSSSDDSFYLSSDDWDENDKSQVETPQRRISNFSEDGNDYENFIKASSTTNDPSSIEAVHKPTPSTSTMKEPNVNQSVEITNKYSAEDSVSTSNQPEIIANVNKSKLPTIEGKDSKSNYRKRKKSTHSISFVIPERIKQIINNIKGNVLNVERLEAFLNHVKKKSKRSKFAKMYTSDVAGLKKQLEEISRQYYLIPLNVAQTRKYNS